LDVFFAELLKIEGLRTVLHWLFSVFFLGEVLQDVQVLCAAGEAGAMSLLVLDEFENEVLVFGAHVGSLEFILCELKPSLKIV
jgi:hypothetical protein